MITPLPFLNRIFPQSATFPTLIYLSPLFSTSPLLLSHTNYTYTYTSRPFIQKKKTLPPKNKKLLVLYDWKLNDWSVWYIIIIIITTPLQFILLYNKHGVLFCQIVGWGHIFVLGSHNPRFVSPDAHTTLFFFFFFFPFLKRPPRVFLWFR